MDILRFIEDIKAHLKLTFDNVDGWFQKIKNVESSAFKRRLDDSADFRTHLSYEFLSAHPYRKRVQKSNEEFFRS